MIDKKTCNGSLIEQIECAQNFVLNHISFIPRIDGIYRSDEPEIPIPVLRECIVNAVAHRSYALIDSPIFVAVYDDSIEITSPGTLPYGLNIEDLMEGISRPRNRAIVRFFKAVGIMEGWGCGVSRMMALCTENGLHKPMIEEVGENVRVTIYRRNAVVPGEVPVKFNKVQEKIAYFIISNPGCRLEDVSSGTGIPRSTVNKAVSEMKTMGKLRRKGSKKTGEWILEGYR